MKQAARLDAAGSELEAIALNRFERAGLPAPVQQARLVPGRRFRADFCWPQHNLVVEIEGGTWTNGRHSRGYGFESDCDKYNLFQLAGYRVLRFTRALVEDGTMIAQVRRALEP